MVGTNVLGEYLKARRQLVPPEMVGLPRGARRRVVGLRREELALLAGVSPDYYLRLEQGRDHNPSPQILDALASVLQLDAEGCTYLYELAGVSRATSHRVAKEYAPAGVSQLIDELPVPAFVQGRFMDVLASNPLARALSPQFWPGVNLVRAAFLDPRDRELHQDWERATREAVSGLRSGAGPDLNDPELVELVEDLSTRSDYFRSLWARHDVRQKTGGDSKMLHPVVGPLDLRHEKFAVNGTHGQILVMYHAEPGSLSYAALRQLADEVVTKA